LRVFDVFEMTVQTVFMLDEQSFFSSLLILCPTWTKCQLRRAKPIT